MKRKKSFWDKPWTEYDHFGPWITFGLFVIVFSIIMGLIVSH